MNRIKIARKLIAMANDIVDEIKSEKPIGNLSGGELENIHNELEEMDEHEFSRLFNESPDEFPEDLFPEDLEEEEDNETEHDYETNLNFCQNGMSLMKQLEEYARKEGDEEDAKSWARQYKKFKRQYDELKLLKSIYGK